MTINTSTASNTAVETSIDRLFEEVVPTPTPVPTPAEQEEYDKWLFGDDDPGLCEPDSEEEMPFE